MGTEQNNKKKERKKEKIKTIILYKALNNNNLLVFHLYNHTISFPLIPFLHLHHEVLHLSCLPFCLIFSWRWAFFRDWCLTVILALLVWVCFGYQSSCSYLVVAAYDPLDPNGNITIKWDIMSWTPDGYVVRIFLVIHLNNELTISYHLTSCVII